MTILCRALAVACLFALAACEPVPADPQALPTLLVLPTETVTFTPSPVTPSDTPEAASTAVEETQVAELDAAITENSTPSATGSPLPDGDETGTEVATATPTPSYTSAVTERPTLTPSMTITDTPTMTPTITPYVEEDLSPLFQLAIVALSSTPPSADFYMPLTLTPTGFAPGVIATSVPSGGPGTLCLPPPGGFSMIYTADLTLSAQIGCPLGSPLSYSAAVQTFERGIMVYVGTSPAAIYVLYNTGTYTRHADTWLDGVDPVSGGEVAPSGLYEPIRGFGKVWRSDPNVRTGLGWATQPESGTTATLLLFQSGQMLALPPLGQVAVMTTSGTHRLIVGGA